jgi:hypothetical protein
MEKYAILLFLILNYAISTSQIVINEASSVNYDVIVDENHERPDWIELYNNSSNSVNLKSWRIGDKNSFEDAWEIPDVNLPAKSHLLIYASDKNYSNSDKFIVESSGKGIFPHANPDSYRFNYKLLNGDFEFSVRIHSLSNVDLFGSVGVIIREDLSNANRFFGVFAQSDERIFCEYLQREKTGDEPVRKYSAMEMIYPDVVLQVARRGDSLIAGIYDYDGYCLESNSRIWNFPDKVYVGLALSATNQKKLGKASFSNLKINGESKDFNILTGQDYELQIPGNSYKSKELHTDFKLSHSGESITLWNENQQIIDQLKIPAMYVDMSYGRYPDGSDELSYFLPPTPNKSNNNIKESILKQPSFSIESGFYDKSINISIYQKDMNAFVYYTTNGSEPNDKSTKYSGEIIHIDKTTVVKARVYQSGYIPSQIETATYFINEPNVGLPFLSFSSDSIYFFDEKIGLFPNPHTTDEFPVSIEYFTSEGYKRCQNRGCVKTHGHGGALSNQTSLRFIAKSKYGGSEFAYPFFGINGQKTYDKFVIRNSGQDWNGAFIRDAFVSVLANNIENVYGTQYQPVMTYLNGKFWGMYNLRERFDDKLLESRYGISSASISIMEPVYRLMQGSLKSYRDLLDNIGKIEDNQIYNYLDSLVDIDNLIDYSAVSFWSNNADWPQNNFKIWKSSELDNKWRWILLDFDLSINYKYTSVYQVNSFKMAMDSAVQNPYLYHFPKILLNSFKNEKFRYKFLNRNCDLLNTSLNKDILTPLFDSLVGNIAKAMPLQLERWKESVTDYLHHYEMMRTYFIERPVYYREQLREYFNLKGISKIEVNSNIENAGTFEINSLKKLPENWTGYYFNGVPVQIKVVPNSGFKFKNWAIDGYNVSDNVNFTYILTDSTKISAIFESSPNQSTDIVIINEIMFKSAPNQDTDDWIELYNAGDTDVDISGWVLKDDSDKRNFAVAESTVLKKGEYLVLIESEEKFKNIHPNINNYFGEFTFGFGTEDMVRIYDKSGKLIDSVKYSNAAPWYPEADGGGPSLELINADYDNSIATSWKVSAINGGTPGRSNSITSVNDILINQFIKVYPNPAFAYTNIYFSIDFDSEIEINICDVFGNPIRKLVNGFYNAGNFTTYWDGKNENGMEMSNGLYFILIKTNKGLIRDKIILN